MELIEMLSEFLADGGGTAVGIVLAAASLAIGLVKKMFHLIILAAVIAAIAIYLGWIAI